ncbi:MAG TPA: hypothetical protein VHH34_02650 [Pseudonocardiaceae bacterium]|nr:hypothetical protein [Pseudonocardiaceae bacterium]
MTSSCDSPDSFPGWLNGISQVLPTRGSRDLLVMVLTGAAPSAVAVTALVTCTVLLAMLAGWAYQRDEGLRYR